MQKPHNKWMWIVIIILLLIAAGWLRDKIFIRINYQIDALKNGESPYPYTGLFSFVNSTSVTTLLRYKWLYTAVFVVLHWLMAWLMVSLLFRDAWNFKLVHVAYAALVSIAGLVYILCFPWSGPVTEKGYLFARSLLGAAQSPLLVMLIGIVCYLRNR